VDGLVLPYAHRVHGSAEGRRRSGQVVHVHSLMQDWYA
jgi:hypothetical protein